MPKTKRRVSKRKGRASANSGVEVITLKIGDIWEGSNTRDPGWEKDVSELMLLIKEQGLLHPVGVKKSVGPNGESYKLLYGSRRREACRRLKWKTIDAIVRSDIKNIKDEYFCKLAENGGRKNLQPMEEARDFDRAINIEKITTPKEIAKRIGVTVSYISQRLQLLKLPQNVQKALSDGCITSTHAREISRVTDIKAQKQLLTKAKELPVKDFKDHVDSLDTEQKKNSGRGRKSKKKQNVPFVKINTGAVRSEKEVVTALGKLDVELRDARHSSNQLREEYIRGLMRGITWVRKMGGSNKLC